MLFLLLISYLSVLDGDINTISNSNPTTCLACSKNTQSCKTSGVRNDFFFLIIASSQIFYHFLQTLSSSVSNPRPDAFKLNNPDIELFFFKGKFNGFIMKYFLNREYVYLVFFFFFLTHHAQYQVRYQKVFTR